MDRCITDFGAKVVDILQTDGKAETDIPAVTE